MRFIFISSFLYLFKKYIKKRFWKYWIQSITKIVRFRCTNRTNFKLSLAGCEMLINIHILHKRNLTYRYYQIYRCTQIKNTYNYLAFCNKMQNWHCNINASNWKIKRMSWESSANNNVYRDSVSSECRKFKWLVREWL